MNLILSHRIDMDNSIRNAVEQAARRPKVRAAVGEVYAQLQREIDLRQPVCSSSGRCCRFEEFGHRLYVTTLELAAFAADRQTPPNQNWDGTGCPFQAGGLCSVHSIRPFGCRVFFCDPTASAWQNEQYERFHARIKRLHDDLDVPYHYVEWRQALILCHLAPAPATATPPPGPESALARKPLSLPQLPL